MFCKHCGKQIANDSSFCQYCGGKLDVVSNEQEEQHEEISTSNGNKEVIKTVAEQPIKVEITKASQNHSSTIANEIVGNLKMIGLALLVALFYIIGFAAIKSKDSKPLTDEGYWGESCYDPSNYSSNYMFLWEQHYAQEICIAPDYTKETKEDKLASDIANIRLGFNPISATDMSIIMSADAQGALNFANEIAKRKKIPQEELNRLKEVAKQEAQKDKKDFQEEISSIRKFSYEEDFSKNAKYAVICCLLTFILGRYFIKLVKWVGINKT